MTMKQRVGEYVLNLRSVGILFSRKLKISIVLLSQEKITDRFVALCEEQYMKKHYWPEFIPWTKCSR